MWNLNKIPKVLFLYWGRNKKLSFMRYMTAYSFAKLNPDWQIKVYYPKKTSVVGETWKCEAQKKNNYQGVDHFDKLQDIKSVELIEFDFDESMLFSDIGNLDTIAETFKSDILRLHLIAEHGGVWSDFDILYVKPMDKMPINQNEFCNVDVGVCYKKIPQIPMFNRIGFLMGGKETNYSYYSEIVSRKAERYDRTNYQSLGSGLINYVHVLPKENIGKIFVYKGNINVFNLPVEVVYPLSSTSPNSLMKYFNGENILIHDCTIGLHWFSGGIVAGDYDNIINQDNIKEYRESQLLRLMEEAHN